MRTMNWRSTFREFHVLGRPLLVLEAGSAFQETVISCTVSRRRELVVDVDGEDPAAVHRKLC